jgi:PAS domain S-box-containing protein
MKELAQTFGPTTGQGGTPTSWFSRSVIGGAVVVASILVAAALIDQRNTAAVNKTAETVIHTHQVLGELERVLSSLRAAESAQRSHLLTGDKIYLDTLKSAREGVERSLAAAEVLTRDNEVQRARFPKLQADVADRLAFMAQTIAARQTEGAEAANAFVRSGRGDAAMLRVASDIGEMIRHENELLAERKAHARASYQWAVVTSWIALAIGLAALASFIALTYRHFRAAALSAESIRQQRELLRTTLTSIGDGVITTDATGVVTSINDVAAALTGWSAEAAVGQPLEAVFQILNEDTRQPVQSPVDRCLKEGAVVGLANHTVLVSKDGRERPIDDSAAPIRTADGAVVGAVLVFRDGSDRKRVESELRQMALDLTDADRRKDDFLATLAHELRNPLAPIRNGLQILKLAKTDQQALDQARTIMERQLGQLVRLVDDLLDVSRITRDKMELRRETVELGSVISNAAETSRPLIDAGRHRLKIHPADEPILLEADPVRLAQLFSNLLNNAAKYTPPGGRIEVVVHREGSDACVSVKDNGEGIDAEALPNIFDMFRQLDRSLDRSQGGLGIGLTLVKRIAEMHGGSVSARSGGIGKGSEFLVRLPIVIFSKIDRPSSADVCDSPIGVCRVLIVDDNRDAALSLEEVLKLMGHDPRVVFDGEAAVEAALDFHPQIILLDIGLPKLNGYDACRKIRALTLNERPIIVAVTGWGQARDRERSREAGFDHYFTKPVDAGQMIGLLAQAPCAAT